MAHHTAGELVISSKREVFLDLLSVGDVYVHLDPLYAQVPPAYKSGPRLILLFGYALPLPTDDVEAKHDGLTATLSFDGVMSKVAIPWTCVYAIVDKNGDGVMWAEDAPREIVDRAVAAKKAQHKPELTVLDGGRRSTNRQRTDQEQDQ